MKIVHRDTQEVIFETTKEKELKEYYAQLLMLYKCFPKIQCPFIICVCDNTVLNTES